MIRKFNFVIATIMKKNILGIHNSLETFINQSIYPRKVQRSFPLILISFYLPQRILLDFPSVTSLASLPFLLLWHRNNNNRERQNLCFTSNKRGHRAADCQQQKYQEKSISKCYTCKKLGHKSFECKLKKQGAAGEIINEELIHGTAVHECNTTNIIHE